MKKICFVLCLILSGTAFAGNAPSFSIHCANEINEGAYPRIRVNVWQEADRYTASGEMMSSDHGPAGNIACNDLRGTLASKGEAVCAGIWKDFTPKDGAPGVIFDTVVTLKFVKVADKFSVSVTLPKAWDSKEAAAYCTAE